MINMILKGFCMGSNKVDLYLNTEVGWYSYQQNEECIIIEGKMNNDDASYKLIKENFLLNITNSLYIDFNAEKCELTIEINSEKVLRQQKIDALRRMNYNIYNTGDEIIYDIWHTGGVPDGTVTDEDYAECLDYFDEIKDLYDGIMFDN